MFNNIFSNKKHKALGRNLYTLIISQVSETGKDKTLFSSGAPDGYELVLYALYFFTIGALSELHEHTLTFSTISLRADMRTLKYPVKEIQSRLDITKECYKQLKIAYFDGNKDGAINRLTDKTLELLGVFNTAKSNKALKTHIEYTINNAPRFVINYKLA